ncbi:MAG: hypothetical protein HQM10_03880 [Candidatus Riflebacteria bacterium]|nr:hypothetical protein [Candidatus Riflebacteria bacterium]
MFVKFIKDYAFAHQGIHVEHFKKDQIKDVSAECANTAMSDGAAKEPSEKEMKALNQAEDKK